MLGVRVRQSQGDSMPIFTDIQDEQFLKSPEDGNSLVTPISSLVTVGVGTSVSTCQDALSLDSRLSYFCLKWKEIYDR